MKQQFYDALWRAYDEHGRDDLPWRQQRRLDGSIDAYMILVSEVMLQQTQVSRVIPKYQNFLAQFPSIDSLAQAPWPAVLSAWNGLGYNRRAKYLHEAAHSLRGALEPWSLEQLTAMKGIGHNTAAATLVYSYNQPHAFIETNIRSVYLQHFFSDEQTVSDKQILQKVSDTLDRENPRRFYWAVMDYGAWLKRHGKGQLSRSASHKKQSSFAGSRRQLRGQVLRELQLSDSCSITRLHEVLQDNRLESVLEDLAAESLIKLRNNRVSL